ncbi:MAG: helix-turn-helix domain-containing protein [Candidatus Omnitrophica bacterium]|nr:helix-turn-helix domain-containing protein [Candidatus Omnitrophota bacterium]
MTYVTVKQIIERTGLKYTTILAWVNKGLLPARKITNGKKSKYLFVWKEVERVIEGCKVATL